MMPIAVNSGSKVSNYGSERAYFMFNTLVLYLAMAFFKFLSIDYLDRNGILSTNVMHKLLVRLVKNGSLFTNNISKYSVVFMCMFLMVSGILWCIS